MHERPGSGSDTAIDAGVDSSALVRFRPLNLT
jgi:hypothetical protein